MTKLNRACPASISADRRNCHEFGSVKRFFNFLIPINLIHTFMITDELHSVPINIAGRAGTPAALPVCVAKLGKMHATSNTDCNVLATSETNPIL
jgi:hypothetical protein